MVLDTLSDDIKHEHAFPWTHLLATCSWKITSFCTYLFFSSGDVPDRRRDTRQLVLATASSFVLCFYIKLRKELHLAGHIWRLRSLDFENLRLAVLLYGLPIVWWLLLSLTYWVDGGAVWHSCKPQLLRLNLSCSAGSSSREPNFPRRCVKLTGIGAVALSPITPRSDWQTLVNAVERHCTDRAPCHSSGDQNRFQPRYDCLLPNADACWYIRWLRI